MDNNRERQENWWSRRPASQESSRRAFLHRGGLILAGSVAGTSIRCGWAAEEPSAKPAVRIGLITDCHYADRDPAGSRHYRETLGKVDEAVRKFNQAGAQIAFELGDYIDAAPEVETEIGFLKKIDAVYARFKGKRHYVLGNHCVHTLTKQEFVANCGMHKPYYAFDHGEFHFVVLDACYREDGVPYGRKNYDWTDTNIPREQVEWLKADLAATAKPTLVFIHQRLDLDRDDEAGKHYAVKNAPQIRRILQRSGNVLAVLQGHYHENDYRQIEGIHYCVVRATVEGSGSENNGYALLDLFADTSIRVDGFRKQDDYEWGKTT